MVRDKLLGVWQEFAAEEENYGQDSYPLFAPHVKQGGRICVFAKRDMNKKIEIAKTRDMEELERYPSSEPRFPARKQ